MPKKIEMVKLDHIADLCPDDLWDQVVAATEVATKRALQESIQAPGIAACPICGSPRIASFAIKHGLNIDQCGSCDFRFTNPPPTPTQLEKFYNSEAKDIENLIFYRTRAARTPIFSKRIELIQRYVSSGSLLDVGGAIGIFVGALTEAASRFHVTVVDLNANAITELKRRYPAVAALNQDIFDHRGSYDIVTLWDTIEHLPDVNRTASHLYGLLKPGGRLFLSTPNVASFEHSVGQERHPQVEPLAHVNYFSPNNLQQLLQKHRFVDIDWVTPNGTFDIAYVNRMLQDGTADLAHIGSFLQHHLQSPEFAAGFAELISRSKLAGNVVVHARRPDC